jgi:hypothetical protein
MGSQLFGRELILDVGARCQDAAKGLTLSYRDRYHFDAVDR